MLLPRWHQLLFQACHVLQVILNTAFCGVLSLSSFLLLFFLPWTIQAPFLPFRLSAFKLHIFQLVLPVSGSDFFSCFRSLHL